jgi:hypothetical protein
MAYRVAQQGSGFGIDQRELVGWPARMHGFGEAAVPVDVIGGFGFDKADIGPPQHSKISAMARQIMARGISAVRLIGHTDPVGTPDYNRSLGQRRADAVRRALLATLDRMRPGSARSIAVTVESAGETQPLSRGPSEPERARDRRVEVFLPGAVRPPPMPQPGPSPTTRTETVKVVAKSSILPVGSAVGSVPCVRLLPSPVPGAVIPVPSGTALQGAALQGFAAMLDRVVSDHIRNDAKDRMYRLFSEQSFRVVCQDGQIVSVTPSPMDTDVGKECSVPGLPCLQPDPLVVTGVTLRRISPDTFAFGWMGRGRPHNLAEAVAFKAICARTSRFIWHNVSGTIRCGASGVMVGVQLSGSRFPTHAVFVNGALRASIPQGLLGMLWDPHPSDPTMVR